MSNYLVGIQKDIRTKTTDNEKLEEEIQKGSELTKSLHDQFKQNKDIAERYDFYYSF